MIQYAIVFKYLRQLLDPADKTEVKSRNTKAALNRLTAYTAEFNCSPKGEINKFEGAKIFNILGFWGEFCL